MVSPNLFPDNESSNIFSELEYTSSFRYKYNEVESQNYLKQSKKGDKILFFKDDSPSTS